LTVWGAHGRSEPAELAIPATLTGRWPSLSNLVEAPAFNVGRAYAAFAADIDKGSHTVPDFADAVRRHEVIAAIERSAASGARVRAQLAPGRPSVSPQTTGFCQTETCLSLSLVNGSRFHPPQRSRSSIPASRAMRSSSEGHTYRNGNEK